LNLFEVLNRLGQVPAKGFPDFAVHSGLLPIDSRRLASKPFSRIDCGFRNLSSLGLLSGFQRPSPCSGFPAVLPCFPAHRFLPRGASFILNRFRCQAAVATSLFRFTSSSALLPGFSFEGRRNLLPFRLLCQLASLTRFFPLPRFLSPARLLRFSGEAASTTASFRVNFVSSTSYFALSACCARPEVPTASAVSPSRPRGRGMYRLAPTESTTLRRLFFPAPPFFCRLRDTSGSAGRGFYHRRVLSQLASSTPYFLFPVRVSHRQRGFAFPSEGRGMYRLIPLESTALRRLPISSFPSRCPTASAASPSRPRGRGFYHRRVSSQQASSRLSSPPPGHVSRPAAPLLSSPPWRRENNPPVALLH